SFCASLQRELSEYYRLVALLQSEVIHEDDCDVSVGSFDGMTLKKLSVWLMQPSLKLTVLASLLDSCSGKIGGELVSTIYSFMKHGDSYIKCLMKNTLSLAVQPIFSLITRWIFEGELEDNHHEFFVLSDPSVRDDRLWHDKFSLRPNMIPSFITFDQAKKILLTGKTINFLRHICADQTSIKERDVVKMSCINDGLCCFSEQNNSFGEMINVIYKQTSLHLLDVLHDKYKLLDHLKAMRDYLLLGQGDFIRHLMDLLEEDLAKPAQMLFLHNLTGILESAIRATNAQYVNADIIKRLDVMLLEVSPGDTGWDVFSLEYHVSGHIRTLFTQDVMITYLKIFNFLWRAKRMEYILSIMWKDQMSYGKVFRLYPEFLPILHTCHLIGSEMLHFVQQIQYYINFEVLECSWVDLMSRIEEAHDLDQVISAHNNFLSSIVSRSLLDSQSLPILTQLRTIFDLVLQFKEQQKFVYNKMDEELEFRRQFKLNQLQRSNKGEWGTDEQTESDEVKRREEFVKQLVPSTLSKLRVLSQSYKKLVENFLSSITTFSDGSLRCLIFRLNFNEFYHHQHPHTGRLSKIMYASHPQKIKGTKEPKL
ncbi:hypothetical protein HELRODRAFT_65285, partial [Helobdella robusta]|uniref:Uncharacterized protein n=1 Tax=Helobdella robusta TaxID=6412 RepID=T1FY54_HELRO